MHQLRKHETSQHSSDLTVMHLTAGCKKVSGSLLNGTMEYGDRRGCVAWCGALGHEAMAWSKPTVSLHDALHEEDIRTHRSAHPRVISPVIICCAQKRKQNTQSWH